MFSGKNRFGFANQDARFSESKKTPFKQRKEGKKFGDLKVQEPGYVKAHICPKCNNCYDFHLSNSGYVGRVPLLLKCLHTVCEECVLYAVPKRRIECAECDATTCFDAESTNRKIQDIFPVNFYVFGLVSYFRRLKPAMPNLRFRLAPTEGKKAEQSPSEGGNATVCSKSNCSANAKLKCLDCDENFCEDCAKAAHEPGKISIKHDVVTLEAVIPELQQNCQLHRNSMLEFACRPCNVNLCCYCVLSGHKDHDYYLLTEMTDEHTTKITDLVSEAENSLRFLRQTDQRITEYLNQNVEPSNSNLDTKISRHFEVFHAKLQVIEKRLHEELTDHGQSRQKALHAIRQKVNQNILFINKLCRYAKQLLNKEDVKYNIQYIIDNLTLALKIKCHLVRQEVTNELRLEYSNVMNDIDEAYAIKCDRNDEFILVGTQDLPDDFDSSVTLDSSTSQSNNTSFTNEIIFILDNNSEDDMSSKNMEHLMVINRTLVKSNESISSGHTSDKKSVNSSTPSSWADEWLALEELGNGNKNLGVVSFENISELEIGNKQTVSVTHINSPASFYVNLAKSKNVSVELSRAIAKYAMGSCMKVDPQINQMYLVKFNDGSSTQWYRGRVTNIDPGNNKYTVFFIDYGNTAAVSKNWIRNIPAKLIKIPPLAIECKIYDVWPPGSSPWDKNVLTLMADIVNKESLLMVVVEKSLSVYSVDLVTLDGSTSVRDALIFSGSGVPLLNSNNLVNETKKEMASYTAKKVIHKFSTKFTEKEMVEVVITYAENPFKMHLILIESQNILNNMKSTMQQFYKGAKKGMVYSLEVGMYVAVYYAFRATPTWFRATVLEVPESRGSVKVELIDVGPTVSVQWENVRKLDDKFYMSESLSFCAEMTDVAPPYGTNSWPESVKEFFLPYIRDEIVLRMSVCRPNPLAVVLVEDMESYKSCLNGLLVFKDYGMAIGNYATDVKWIADDDTPNFTSEMMKTIQSRGSIHDESYVDDCNGIQKEVEIVSVENPNSIYVRFLDLKPKYNALYNQMQLCYANCEFVSRQWLPKQPTVVKYNDEYLRGIVEKEVSPGVYKVNLKDLGKSIEVDASNMTTLLLTFTKCPELITRCHLANIIPAGGSEKWTAMACELLQETLKDKVKIYLTKCGKIDMETRSLPVLLWYKQFVAGGPLEQSKTVLCSVNKILLKNGLALKANVKEILQKDFVRKDSVEKKFWDWLPPTLIMDDHIVAIPTCVNDHGHIYIHDIRDEEPLEEMSEKLMGHFENSTVDNKLEDWHVGDICMARYFLNEQWYRAKVTGVNENSVSVIMVDYGNEEDLQPDDLRKEILFENIPVFTSVVYLQDVDPLEGVWHTDDLDTLHAAIVDKEMDVYFINGHDNNNASSVCMSYKNISINEFLLTKCKHLKNSIKESNKIEDLPTLDSEYVLDYESDGGSDVLILDEEKSVIESTESLLTYKIDSLPADKDIEIVIINLLHYNVIVFELTNYENVNLDAFDKMQAEIQTEAPNLPVLTNLSLDAPCIVKYTQDDSYYRGKILGLRENEALIWFVDYGNFEFIPKTEIKEIQPRWIEYPVQHHLADIDGIELVDSSKENLIKEHFASFYSTMLVADVVSQDPLKVRLYDKKTRKLIYQEFIDDGTLRLVVN